MNNTNDIFNREFSRQYDTSNQGLNTINNNLHFLISVLLRDLPEQARILCVGVGTGSEILHLARQHPGWQFTGVDPSPDMLTICDEKLQHEGLSERCTLIEGYLNAVPVTGDYDAVLCLLVTHFIQDAERAGIYQQINAQLNNGGRMICAEIAGDMSAADFDQQLTSWAAMHSMVSKTERHPQDMKTQFNQRLLLLAPEETERLIIRSGFAPPQHVFQSLLIHGWVARKSVQGQG